MRSDLGRPTSGRVVAPAPVANAIPAAAVVCRRRFEHVLTVLRRMFPTDDEAAASSAVRKRAAVLVGDVFGYEAMS